MSNALKCLKLSRIWQNFVLTKKFHLFFLHIASILCIATVYVYSKLSVNVHYTLTPYTVVNIHDYCYVYNCHVFYCHVCIAVSCQSYCRHCDCIHLRVIHIGTSVNFVQCTCTLHAIFVTIVTQCAYREYILKPRRKMHLFPCWHFTCITLYVVYRRSN